MTPNEKEFEPIVLRVTQIDTFELDKELLEMLKNSLSEDLFKYIQVNFLIRHQVEIFTAIKVLLWYLTFYRNGQTIGQSTLDWHYKEHPAGKALRKIVHLIVYCLDDWFEVRIKNKIANNKLATLLEAFFKSASLLNFLAFLFNGNYLHLWQRLFNFNSVYSSRQYLREIDTELTERELLWHSYFTLVKFLNKTFNLKNYLLNKLKRRLKQKRGALGSMAQMVKDESDFESECAVCQQSLVNACRSNTSSCKHLFCFYCIQSSLALNGASFSCPKCSSVIESFRLCF